jgi:hypothetical protein
MLNIIEVFEPIDESQRFGALVTLERCGGLWAHRDLGIRGFKTSGDERVTNIGKRLGAAQYLKRAIFVADHIIRPGLECGFHERIFIRLGWENHHPALFKQKGNTSVGA